MVSAIARKVREGAISRSDGHKVAMTFLAHLEDGYYTRIPVERTHYHIAREWFERFEFPLRTLDALHLAIAHVRRLRLATGDDALARSATAVGMRVHRIGPAHKA
jgi:predicted nucleic acid-binding protein